MVNRIDRCFRSAEADRTILTLGLIFDYVQSSAADQPDLAGCAKYYDYIPQVSPGAMQGLIRSGGSGLETTILKNRF